MVHTDRVKKIVVVDDDAEMLQFVTAALGGSYQVDSADDGAAGLEKVQRLRPDLVVLDLLMPRMHGFEVCQKIKQSADLKGTKVLISSSKSYQHDVRTAVEETGADGYIVKPFEVSEFIRRVDAMLGTA